MVVLLVLNMPYEAGFSVLDIYSVFTVVKVEEWEGREKLSGFKCQ